MSESFGANIKLAVDPGSKNSLQKSIQSLVDKCDIKIKKITVEPNKNVLKSTADSLSKQLQAAVSKSAENLTIDSIKVGNLNISGLESELKSIKSSAHEAGEEGKSFGVKLKSAFDLISGQNLSASYMSTIKQLLSKMAASALEVESAMTGLKKAASGTASAYEKFLDSAVSRSKSLGVTLTDTINSVTDFARLGYSLDEAVKLSEAALVYKNIGSGIKTVGEASQSIISIMRAFGVEAGGAMDIVDKFAEIGGGFAISSAGIGDSLQASASALAAAGNTLEESIALTAGMNAVLKDPAGVGEALQAGSIYLRVGL